jgi:DNA-binding response OmpR family regulator
LGVLFEPEGDAVVFAVDQESVRNGSSGFQVLSGKAPTASFPFRRQELVTRARAAIRHANGLTGSRVARFGDVRIDFTSMEVTRLGERATLTAQEFKALKFFVMNPRRVISRDELLNEVWGYENYPCTRTVDNHVLKLRQKLECDPADPVHFLTVHRVGYKFIP